MATLDSLTNKWNTWKQRQKQVSEASAEKEDTPYEKVKQVVGILILCLYRLRKVVLAAPVVYYALKIADYNMENLPEYVGINLQSNGAFADIISRNTAVMGPLVVTGVCLLLMFFSRRALPTWAISVFSLALPLVILLSNLYPA